MTRKEFWKKSDLIIQVRLIMLAGVLAAPEPYYTSSMANITELARNEGNQI